MYFTSFFCLVVKILHTIKNEFTTGYIVRKGKGGYSRRQKKQKPWVQGSVPKWPGLGYFYVRHFEFLWNERQSTEAQSLDCESDCMEEIKQKRLYWLRVLWGE